MGFRLFFDYRFVETGKKALSVSRPMRWKQSRKLVRVVENPICSKNNSGYRLEGGVLFHLTNLNDIRQRV